MKTLSFFFLFHSSFCLAQAKWFGAPDASKLVETENVSIVFSSQNLKEAASMFGHTFLVFHNGERPMPSDLTIEFRGVMIHGFSDYPKAIFGGLKGKYELNFLLYKMREYHAEGRDLWFYRIKLEKIEISRLILDLKKRLLTDYKYSFLRKNCSYFINDPIFLAAKKEYQIYLSTIPMQSLRQLKDSDLIHLQSAFVMPSDVNVANQLILELPKERIEDFRLFYQYENTTFSPKNKLEEKIFSNVLNIKVQSLAEKEKRNSLFESKKRYRESIPSKDYFSLDPMLKFGDSFWAVYGSVNRSDTFRFEIRPAQRSYTSNYIDPFNFSTFDVFKPILRKNRRSIILDEFNVLKLESILGKNFFFPGYDKYLDLSYYNWNFLSQQSSETVLRYGVGKSLILKRLSLTIMPYVGLRYYEHEKVDRASTDQGLLLIGQFNPSDSFSSKVSVARYLFSPFNFNTSYKFETSYKISLHVSVIGKALSTSQTLDKNAYYELGFAYLY
jgi:hypothetical protein